MATESWSTKIRDEGRMRSLSSALCALSSLVPPSPILDTSDLVSCTSGEIPIFFESNSTSSIIHSEGSEIIMSCITENSSSMETVGTFGPTTRRDCQNTVDLQATTWLGQDLLRNDINITSTITDRDCESASPIPRQRTSKLHFARVSACVASANYTNDNKLKLFSDIIHRLGLMVSSRSEGALQKFGYATPFEDEKENEMREQAYLPLSQTFSTLATPSLTSPSPSLSDGLARIRPTSPPIKLGSYPSTDHSTENVEPGERARLHDHPFCDTSEFQHPHVRMYPNMVVKPGTLSRLSWTAQGDADRLQLIYPKKSHSNVDQKFAFLPERLSWLRNLVVDLLIDQEGFRTIQPSFRLKGYSSHFRDWDDHMHLAADIRETEGVVYFMPVKRESFHFRCAPLHSPPTLRRVTINGNETKDYISRQASLSIKSNGVYVVRGTETLASGNSSISNHNFDSPRLKWKLEYAVDDRRVESTGQIMEGEKTLTPLTFSCSPVLLHSQRAKKVGLMHVVLKSFTPNLTAEKMELPTLPPRSGPSISGLKATIQSTTTHYLAKSYAWTRHKPARFNILRHEDQELLIKSRFTMKHLNMHVFRKSPDPVVSQQERRHS